MELAQYPTTPFGEARRTLGSHGYVAYFPAPIPRSLELPTRTVRRLADAERALGQLAGVGRLLPSPDLLLRPYLVREAISSTRIEGTQATMAEVFELQASGEQPKPDVEEVVNYVAAMRWGLEQLDALPLSSRLVRELHRRLMDGVRGRDLAPGAFRASQNWIGAPGSTIESAEFVPPPPGEIPSLLADWERFAHEDGELPVLVQAALLHSQFEAIHPFLDGNGRVGRLLIVFFLIARGRLPAPLLYVSEHLERNRGRYYAALQTIHERGDAIPWLDLFLAAVETESIDAVERAHAILELRERYRKTALAVGGANEIELVELICENPIVSARSVEDHVRVSRPTALRLLGKLEREGLLSMGSEGRRGQRRYVAREMLALVSGRA